MIWANLLHLGYNMWGDWENPNLPWSPDYWAATPYLRFDEDIWKTLTARMVEAGLNMVVIDLGEGVRYDSHPELAVKGSWSGKKLVKELARLRSIGLEPIPKLNFSTTHDIWLGEYERCVSSPIYYKVCADLIAEVCDLFDRPRFFHLGMDEETAGHQVNFIHVVSRQFDLWWHDLLFLAREVEKHGSRPWVWSDDIWYHHDKFLETMPTSVVQSNWYYWDNYNRRRDPRVQAWLDLDERGFDQIPTASIWKYDENLADMVRYLRPRLSSEHLLGFMQTPWHPTMPEFLDRHLRAIDLTGAVIAGTKGRGR
jgi:hypothetical protein